MMEQLAESLRDGQNDDEEDNLFPGFPMFQGGGFPTFPGGFIPGYNHLNPYRDPNAPFGSIYRHGWGQQKRVMPQPVPPRATRRPIYSWPTQPTITTTTTTTTTTTSTTTSTSTTTWAPSGMDNGKVLVRSVTIIAADCPPCDVTGLQIQLHGEETVMGIAACSASLDVSRIDEGNGPEIFSWTGESLEPDDKLAGCYREPLNKEITDGGTITFSSGGAGARWAPETLCVDWWMSDNFPYICDIECFSIEEVNLEEAETCNLINCTALKIGSIECPREQM